MWQDNSAETTEDLYDTIPAVAWDHWYPIEAYYLMQTLMPTVAEASLQEGPGSGAGT